MTKEMVILKAGVRVEDRRTVAGKQDNTDLPACLTELHCPKCDEDYVIITVQTYTQDYTATCLKCRGMRSSHQAYIELQENQVEMHKKYTEDNRKELKEYRNKYVRLRRLVGTLIDGTRDLEDESAWDGYEYLPETRRVMEEQMEKVRDKMAEIAGKVDTVLENMDLSIPVLCPKCSDPLHFSMAGGGALVCSCGFAIDIPSWKAKKQS